MPRVVTAGVPTRMPPGLKGELVSNGIAFLFTVMPARSSDFLRFFAVQVFRAKINQHEVVVGAAGNDAITVLAEPRGERFGVDHYLPLIFAKLRLERFMKANGFGSDDVHQWAALDARENGRIDLFGEFLFAHNDAAARPAQTLMCSGGDKMCVRDRAWMLAARNEPGDVRHVDEQEARRPNPQSGAAAGNR